MEFLDARRLTGPSLLFDGPAAILDVAATASEIDEFESSFVHLPPEESRHLRDLMFLHDKVRDAPGAPTRSRTLVRTAAALVPPTIAFVITARTIAPKIISAGIPN